MNSMHGNDLLLVTYGSPLASFCRIFAEVRRKNTDGEPFIINIFMVERRHRSNAKRGGQTRYPAIEAA
jgi:hypothetical protein